MEAIVTLSAKQPSVEQVFRTVEQKRDRIITLLRDLIKIPTVVPPGNNYGDLVNFVEPLFKKLGFTTERVIVPDEHIKAIPYPLEGPRINLVATREHGKKEAVTIYAHMDVVPIEEPWTKDPFAGIVENGKLYGRGACDTKGNLAAAILAVKAIKESKRPFKGRIILAIPVDEEGLMTGIKHMIKRGHLKGVDAAIICEPEQNQICISQKGALRVRIEVSGKMSHGCMPLTGFNPILPMVEIIQRVKKLEKEEIENHGQDEFLGFPSITPTVLRAPIKGEPQLNVMPSGCEAMVDIRTIPGQSHEKLKSNLIRIVKDVEREFRKDLTSGWEKAIREQLKPGLSEGLSFSAGIDIFEDRPWTKTDRHERIVRAVAKAYRLVTGNEPIYNGVPGATDGTFIHAWAKIPIITTGAGDRMVPHQKDEWIGIDELVDAAKIFAISILEFLGE